MEHPVYASILPFSFCILSTSVPLVLQLFISTYSDLLIARSVRIFFCFDNFYIAIFRNSFLLTCPAFFSEHDVSTLCVPLGCTLSRDCVFFLASSLFLILARPSSLSRPSCSSALEWISRLGWASSHVPRAGQGRVFTPRERKGARWLVLGCLCSSSSFACSGRNRVVHGIDARDKQREVAPKGRPCCMSPSEAELIFAFAEFLNSITQITIANY